MPRVQFSDVVPPEKRSIRNVPIPSAGRRAKTATPQPKVVREEIREVKKAAEVEAIPIPINTVSSIPKKAEAPYKRPEQPYYHEDRLPTSKSRKKMVYSVVALLAIVGFIGTMMTVFASANVLVTPKTEALTVATTITAIPEALETGSANVPYEIIKITKQKSVDVEAKGEEMVERKASGKITIYNNFSTDPQRLITRTRFETSDGLIYRIAESITIPGKTSSAPGQLEVEVFADEAGAKYNIGKTDFTVPGFKSDSARFSGFYAKSSTEMSGGLVGKVKKIDEATRQSALQTLESDLRSDAEKDFSTKIPEGLVSLQGNVVYEFRELPQKDSGDTTTLTKEVTAYAIMLNQASLSHKLASGYLASSTDWQDIEALINDFTSIRITDKPAKLEAGSTITLKLDGPAVAVAKVDKEAISNALSGIPRGSIGDTMNQFVGVKSIRATIRPMWKKSFPDSPAKIHVDTE